LTAVVIGVKDSAIDNPGKREEMSSEKGTEVADTGTSNGTESPESQGSPARKESSETSTASTSAVQSEGESAGGSVAAENHENLQTGQAKSSEAIAREREVSLDETPDLQRLAAELSEYKDKYLRALADFQNLKERTVRERSELLKFQGEPVLLDIIPVLDNLELALQYADSDPQKILEGLKMIHKQFVDALERWGVKGVSGLGELFDPQRQNAISKVASADKEPGTVLQELKKAYFYKEKLIRVGEVVVADGEKLH
jgi:molecular chaperone GrpE